MEILIGICGILCIATLVVCSRVIQLQRLYNVLETQLQHQIDVNAGWRMEVKSLNDRLAQAHLSVAMWQQKVRSLEFKYGE